jgi:hypothetical protein
MYSHNLDTGETTMTKLNTLAAAVLVSAMAVTPVFAQAAIQEPGMFAFYHPNADVLNGGAPTPEAALASAPAAASEAYTATEGGVGRSSVESYRANDRAAATVLHHARRYTVR